MNWNCLFHLANVTNQKYEIKMLQTINNIEIESVTNRFFHNFVLTYATRVDSRLLRYCFCPFPLPQPSDAEVIPRHSAKSLTIITNVTWPTRDKGNYTNRLEPQCTTFSLTALWDLARALPDYSEQFWRIPRVYSDSLFNTSPPPVCLRFYPPIPRPVGSAA